MPALTRKVMSCLSICTMLAVLTCCFAFADEQQTSENNPSSLLEINGSTTVRQTQKVVEAGNQLGKEIDRLGHWSGRYLGDWVNGRTIADITWLKLGFCMLLVFIVVVIERMLQWIIHSKLKNVSVDEDVIPWGKLFLRALSRPISLFIWIYGIYLAISPLFPHFQSEEGKNLVQLILMKAADIGGTIAVIWFLFRLVELIDIRLKRWAGKTENTLDDMLAPLLGRTLRIFIVVIGGIILLQNMTGIEIGPLLASLGLGGLAFALAAKDSVANLFGTLTILFDKPFQVGERIVISGYDGVVESVGFRSTRIRTLTGHLVSIPNEKVINTMVENIGKRPSIRWLTNITITYDTPPEKIARAVDIIRNILENHEGMNSEFPPRVYFSGFNEWSLNILMVLWYYPPDYWAYMAFVQKTCLQILEAFENEGIDFAFPTQTVYMANDEKRQLAIKMLKGEGEQGHLM